MIDVAMSEDQRGDGSLVDAGGLDVGQDDLKASASATVDHDRLPVKTYYERGGVLGMRDLRPADQIDVPGNRLRIRHRCCHLVWIRCE